MDATRVKHGIVGGLFGGAAQSALRSIALGTAY